MAAILKRKINSFWNLDMFYLYGKEHICCMLYAEFDKHKSFLSG